MLCNRSLTGEPFLREYQLRTFSRKVQAYDTWWKQGKSYLCRMVDMIHMGYVDEILFGREVIERLPTLVRKWVTEARRRDRIQKQFHGR